MLRQWSLREPNRGCDRERSLAKNGRPEEMVHESDEPLHSPQRCVEGNLVQVLDDDVVIVLREMGRIVSPSHKRIGVAGPDPMNVDAIEVHSLRGILP